MKRDGALPAKGSTATLGLNRTHLYSPAMAMIPIGETCALAAALSWAIALVLFKRSGERMSPVSLSLFKNIVALILLVLTLIVMSDGVSALEPFETIDICILLLSGVLGIALADTVFFYSLERIGVGVIAIVDCLYSPLIILFSFLILSEKLTMLDYVGTALILVAVFISSRHTPPAGCSRAQVVAGILLCALAMALMGIGIVIATPVLRLPFPLMWATTLRLIAGTAALALLTLLSSKRKAYYSALKPGPVWKYCLPASVLGSYLAMIFWVAGFTYTAKAGVAAILNQTTTIFAIILATLILKESFTRRKLLAVTFAMFGVLLVLGKDMWSELWHRVWDGTLVAFLRV